jgi:general stress protein CsbA
MEEQIKQSNPTLHKYLFTVTTFSKLLAMILFITLPFAGFYLGMKYQEKTNIIAISLFLPTFVLILRYSLNSGRILLLLQL